MRNPHRTPEAADPPKLRIAVLGAGAVGGYFGGRLARAGQEVTFIARGATAAALRSHGLRVESVAGDFVVRPARVSEDPVEVGPVDLVLLGVKAWQVAEVAPKLAPLLGGGSAVLPLQNGVETVDRLSEALGRSRVLGGLCKIICLQLAPGHLRHAGAEPFVALNELDNRPSERVEAIRSAFAAAGVRVEVPADIHAAIWSKFLFITAVSGVGAAARVTLGELRAQPRTRRLLEDALGEIEALARARGIALAGDVVDTTMAFIDGLPAAGTASMQRDIMEGRPSELEAQVGAVVRLAATAGVEVPIHRTLYALLLPLERRARGG